jgi:hypothetical protein
VSIVDFKEQAMALWLAAFVGIFSSMALNASREAAPTGFALIISAKAEIQALASPEVRLRITEGMGSDAGPWFLDPTSEPR